MSTGIWFQFCIFFFIKIKKKTPKTFTKCLARWWFKEDLCTSMAKKMHCFGPPSYTWRTVSGCAAIVHSFADYFRNEPYLSKDTAAAAANCNIGHIADLHFRIRAKFLPYTCLYSCRIARLFINLLIQHRVIYCRAGRGVWWRSERKRKKNEYRQQQPFVHPSVRNIKLFFETWNFFYTIKERVTFMDLLRD